MKNRSIYRLYGRKRVIRVGTYLLTLGFVLLTALFSVAQPPKTTYAATGFQCGGYSPSQPKGSGTVRTVNNTSQLNAAFNAARPGDVINLNSGTYGTMHYRSGSYASGTASAPIVIQAGPGQNPVINPNDITAGYNGIWVENHDYIHIRGLEIRNAGFGAIIENTNGAVFEHNEVHTIGQAAFAIRGAATGTVSTNGKVLCNEMHDTGVYLDEWSEGIYIGKGAAQYTDRSHDILVKGNNLYNIQNEPIDIKKYTYNITIEDNLIHDSDPNYGGAITVAVNRDNWQNGNYVIQRNRIWNIAHNPSQSGSYYAQAIAIGHGNAVVQNNIIWNINTNNTADISDIQLYGDPTTSGRNYAFGNNNAKTVEIYNNTIWGCQNDCVKQIISAGQIVPNVIAKNNLASNTGSLLSSGGNRQATSGDFVGPLTGAADAGQGAGSGFTLKSSSSAVNSAQTLSGNTKIDAFDNERTGQWDFGALELNAQGGSGGGDSGDDGGGGSDDGGGGSSEGQSTVLIRARGDTGTESMFLSINGQNVASFTGLSTTMSTYTYEVADPVTIDTIRVNFDSNGTSNGADKNIQIDYIEIDGQRFQTEASTVRSTGTWDAANGCSEGYKQSETLHCNGYAEYEDAKGLALGGALPSTGSVNSWFDVGSGATTISADITPRYGEDGQHQYNLFSLLNSVAGLSAGLVTDGGTAYDIDGNVFALTAQGATQAFPESGVSTGVVSGNAGQVLAKSYDWAVGKTYKVTLKREALVESENAYRWSATVTDTDSNSSMKLGEVLLPGGDDLGQGSVYHQRIGGPAPTCSSSSTNLEKAGATFTNLSSNVTNISFTGEPAPNDIFASETCADYLHFTNDSDWAATGFGITQSEFDDYNIGDEMAAECSTANPLRLNVASDIDGSFTAWVRSQRKSDSSTRLYASINDRCSEIALGEQDQWQWGETSQKFDIAEGNQVMELHLGTGEVWVDRLLLTVDDDCIPTDEEGSSCLLDPIDISLVGISQGETIDKSEGRVVFAEVNGIGESPDVDFRFDEGDPTAANRIGNDSVFCLAPVANDACSAWDPAELDNGEHKIRVSVEDRGRSVSLERNFTVGDENMPPPDDPGGDDPVDPTKDIASTFEAEAYSAFNDADGVDTNPEGSNSTCRNDNPPDIKSSGSGCTIGWVDPGDWYEWEIDVSKAGDYSFDVRYANGQNSDSLVDFLVNGQRQINDKSLSPTDNWGSLSYANIGTLKLKKGVNKIRFEQVRYVDFDFFTLTGPGEVKAIGFEGGGFSGESSTIDIRARGHTGTENMELRINGKTVKKFNKLSKLARTYSHIVTEPTTIDSIRVYFTNNAYIGSGPNRQDRNIDLDYIEIDGQRFETEAPLVRSLGIWTNQTRCSEGYKQSEYFACNGWVEYTEAAGLGLAGADPTDSQGAYSIVTVRARGQTGEENMDLRINGAIVSNWNNLSRTMTSYSQAIAKPVTIDDIRVHFTNDKYIPRRFDRNLIVDYIEIDGERFESEADSVKSRGNWSRSTGCRVGYKQSEKLHCNGWFEYRDARGVKLAEPGSLAAANQQDDTADPGVVYAAANPFSQFAHSGSHGSYDEAHDIQRGSGRTAATGGSGGVLSADADISDDSPVVFVDPLSPPDSSITGSALLSVPKTELLDEAATITYWLDNIELSSAPASIPAVAVSTADFVNGDHVLSAVIRSPSGSEDSVSIPIELDNSLLASARAWLATYPLIAVVLLISSAIFAYLGTRRLIEFARASESATARKITITSGDILRASPEHHRLTPQAVGGLGLVIAIGITGIVLAAPIVSGDVGYSGNASIVLQPEDANLNDAYPTGIDNSGATPVGYARMVAGDNPVNSGTITFEAEAYTTFNDADGIDNNPADSGNGCRNDNPPDIKSSGSGCTIGWIDPGDWYEWEVNAPAAGNYSLDVRYANGGTSNTSVDFLINGQRQIDNKSLSPSGSWSTLADANVGVVTLKEGVNKIRFEQVGFVDLDFLTLTGPGATGGGGSGSGGGGGSGGTGGGSGSADNAKSQGIVAIGDSLMHRADAGPKLQTALNNDGWQGVAINAQGCRSIGGASNACSAPQIQSLNEILDAVAASNFDNAGEVSIGEDINTALRNYNTVVIALGTNDSQNDTNETESRIRSAVSKLRNINSDIDIHWTINCEKRNGSFSGPPVNQALNRIKDELDIELIDWRSECQESYFTDSVPHYNSAGAQAYADVISAGVEPADGEGGGSSGGGSGSGSGGGGGSGGGAGTSQDYDSNLAVLRAQTFRNRKEDGSQFRTTPSASLPLGSGSPLLGPRSEYLGNPNGNPEQAFPVSSGGQFRTACEFSHFAYDDPLVFPNQPGKSHLHMFFGNTDVNAYSTYDTLINSGSSTCNGQELNRTAYWAPAMFDAQGNVRIPERIVVYYKGEGLARGSSTTYPEKAAFISNANNPDINRLSESIGGAAGVKFSFICSDQYYGPRAPTSNNVPVCSGGRQPWRDTLVHNIKFPQCWNRQDPSNWRSNFHPPFTGSWYFSACTWDQYNDATFPNMEYFIHYEIAQNENTANWYLSSDVNPNSLARDVPAGSTTHADWWGGWNKQVNQMWIDNCVNYKNPSGAASGCGMGYLTDGGTDGNNPVPGPALKYRENYSQGIKVPASQIYNELCTNKTRSYTTPASAAWCNP